MFPDLESSTDGEEGREEPGERRRSEGRGGRREQEEREERESGEKERGWLRWPNPRKGAREAGRER